MHPSAGGARPLDNHHRHDHDHDNRPLHSPPAKRYAARSSTLAKPGSVPSTFATSPDPFTSCHLAPPPSAPIMKDQASWHRAGPLRLSLVSRMSTNLILTIFLAILIISPVSAVRIKNFQNCLSDSYRGRNPPLLQWEPVLVEATFDTKNASHNLHVTVWGNVTGSQYGTDVPSGENSSYWDNNSETNGKIVRIPDTVYNKATTLEQKINFLTYEPWENRVDFCQGGLSSGSSCPLGPVFGNVSITDGLPSINISSNMNSSYAFSSLDANFLIIYGDSQATNIGCISAVVTPDLGGLTWLLKILPLVILLFMGMAVLFSAILSPWGSSDTFHWTSNYGRDVDLLRLVTPGFGDCLQYIQFITLTGGLSLQYPGFYKPIVSQMAWSTLMFNESFIANAESWQSLVDGIYVTDAEYGLQEMGQLVGMAETEDIWAGMMVWLCVCIASVTVLVQGGFVAQWLYRKIKNTSEEDLRSKNIPFSVGNIVRIVFNFFLLPVVALSCFQLVVAGSSPGYAIGLAVLTLIFLIGFASYLFWLIIRTRPKSVLYDDLPTVLLYGPLYNTYSDEAAAYALIPVLLTFIRGIAIGAVQPSGIAQVVLLAICEVIQVLTIHAFRPFQSATSMFSVCLFFFSAASFDANSSFPPHKISLCLPRSRIFYLFNPPPVMDQRELEARVKALTKCVAANEPPENAIKLLDSLKKDAAPTEEMLRATRAGVFVGKLRSNPNKEIARAASELVIKWKKLVEKEKNSKLQSSKKGSPAPAPTSSPAPPSSSGGGAKKAFKGDPEKRKFDSDGVDIKRTDSNTRNQCIGLIYNGLAYRSTASESDVIAKAVAVEHAAFVMFKGEGAEYKKKIRSLFANLKNKSNRELGRRVMSGEVSAEKFVGMTDDDLKSEDQRKKEIELEKENMKKAQVPMAEKSISDSLECSRCKQKKVSYTQAQTRSADEPMTTFCECMNCGHRWKFS